MLLLQGLFNCSIARYGTDSVVAMTRDSAKLFAIIWSTENKLLPYYSFQNKLFLFWWEENK